MKQNKIPSCIFTHFVKPTRYKNAKIRVNGYTFITTGDYEFKYDPNKSYDMNHRNAAEAFASECGIDESLFMTKLPTARIRVFIPIDKSDAARIVGQKKKKA